MLRRHLLAAPLLAFAGSVGAQEIADGGAAWARAVTLTWGDILRIPINTLTTGAFPMYRVAQSETELAEARARAAEIRQAGETEIARCRAMIATLGAAPQVGGEEQAIIDQVAPDQVTALDRLAVLFPYLERATLRFVTGEVPFDRIMRACNYALFAETNWIMASSTKVGRLGNEPGSFADLIFRMVTLDFLVSSVTCSAYVHILNDDTREPLSALSGVLYAAAGETREIAAAFAAPDMARLNLNGSQRQRLTQILPQLTGVAETHAASLEQSARAVQTLTSEQILATEAGQAHAPQFMNEAGPLITQARIQL